MRNRIAARWKFIDRADPENTNNYLNRNLTSFSQLTGSHVCSPLRPCLPAEMYNWAKGVISKKWVLYHGAGTPSFPNGRGAPGKAPPLRSLAPSSPSPFCELTPDAGSLWVKHSFTKSYFLSHPLEMEDTCIECVQIQSAVLGSSNIQNGVKYRPFPQGSGYLGGKKTGPQMNKRVMSKSHSIGNWHHENLGSSLSSDSSYWVPSEVLWFSEL